MPSARRLGKRARGHGNRRLRLNFPAPPSIIFIFRALQEQNHVRKKKIMSPTPRQRENLPPPLDFSSIVALLYIPAKIKLGLLNDPAKNAPDIDLPQAAG